MSQSTLPSRTILVPGRNCWSRQPVEEAGLLIDARQYFRAFYEAARQAQRFLLIAGWRFNSDVRLLHGRDAKEAGGEMKFLPFLDGLCRDKPDLHIYVLAWDFSINYGLEWEWFQEWKFQRGRHGRLWFRFDSHHAVGASHHQKFVVVDGKLAFVGGLDFNADNWDDRTHRAHHPDRYDSGQEPHGPYHDMQAFVTGPAAQELAGYFCRRWQAATDQTLQLPPVPPGPAPKLKPSVRIAARQTAFGHLQPMTLTDPTEERYVRQLYLDAIDAAEELIWAENQYFSSQAIFDALMRRLKAVNRSQLEIVLMLPKQLHSWVEAVAMEGPRVTLLDHLRQAAAKHGHRLGLYYSTALARDGSEVPILIHSKCLSVDDRFLTVGSANFSNRSMGLDTELNVAWEATTRERDFALSRSLRRVRVSLLAEHCGLRPRAAARRGLFRRRGLVACLDRIATAKKHRLRILTKEAIVEDRKWVEKLSEWGFSFDPGRPALEEALYEPTATNAHSPPGTDQAWFREWLPSTSGTK